jgi:hypothetical protein
VIFPEKDQYCLELAHDFAKILYDVVGVPFSLDYETQAPEGISME